jgi:hypothetical protein
MAVSSEMAVKRFAQAAAALAPGSRRRFTALQPRGEKGPVCQHRERSKPRSD